VDDGTQQLILDVTDGNPGAFTIIRHLMAFTIWHQLLHFLKNQRLVGSELWRIVKDEYTHDYGRFVDDQLARMAPERAQTLHTLQHRPRSRQT
jgi:hypothetical protein